MHHMNEIIRHVCLPAGACHDGVFDFGYFIYCSGANLAHMTYA